MAQKKLILDITDAVADIVIREFFDKKDVSVRVEGDQILEAQLEKAIRSGCFGTVSDLLVQVLEKNLLATIEFPSGLKVYAIGKDSVKMVVVVDGKSGEKAVFIAY